MLYYLALTGLLLHSYFWGLGLAYLTLPRHWRRFWWAFAPGYGVALQSGVVWVGSLVGLKGTEAYADLSLVLTAVLLAAAGNRAGWKNVLSGCARWKRWLPQVGLLAVAGWMLVSPMAGLTKGLSTSSLGSCDQADYAAGARMLKSFSKNDGEGLLGQVEVTHVGEVETFFDVWAYLNHFTPSALIAHHGAVFREEPYRLVSLMGVVFLLLNVPSTILLARVAVGLRGWWSLAVGALLAVSPLMAYGVHQGALAQFLGALGITQVTLGVMGAGRLAERGRWTWGFLGMFLAGFWILAGSYHFILVVCLVPGLAWLGLRGLMIRRWVPGMRALAVTLAGLAGAGAFGWVRIAGIVERFRQFEIHNFGWAIPVQTLEGWMGLVTDTQLHPPESWQQLVFGVALVLAIGNAGRMLARRDGGAVAGALALLVPGITGYLWIVLETHERANASYDAYKLLSVFLPGILAACCLWMRMGGLLRGNLRWAVVAAAGALLVGNVAGANRFREKMALPPLRVEWTLRDLADLEGKPEIPSVNLRMPEVWDRLWASQFLLGTRQYFPVTTYEGRRSTPLRGDWDLDNTPLRGFPARAEDVNLVNEHYFLVRAGVPRVLAEWDGDWLAGERHRVLRWRWFAEDGGIRLENGLGVPTPVLLAFQVRGVSPRILRAELAGQVETWPLDGRLQDFSTRNFVLAPGRSRLVFTTDRPAESPGGGDDRRVSAALYFLQVQPRPESTEAPVLAEGEGGRQP